MIRELDLGSMTIRSYDLYPEHGHSAGFLHIRESEESQRRSSDFLHSRHQIQPPFTTLCDIYGFENPEYSRCVVPAFPGQSDFWGHLASGHFDSGTTTQTDLSHPTVLYFVKVLANTLLCKMEPNKVRVQELTLLYYAVQDLVDLSDLEGPADDQWPNLGAVCAEHDITQITLRSEFLSQIRGSDVELRDEIHRDSRITQ